MHPRLLPMKNIEGIDDGAGSRVGVQLPHAVHHLPVGELLVGAQLGDGVAAVSYTHLEEEEVQLANLIYYPDRNLGKIRKTGLFTEDFQKITIYRLVQICKVVSSKYTRSKVRKKMPKEFAYVIDELLHVDYNDDNKRIYYSEIIHSIIDNLSLIHS